MSMPSASGPSWNPPAPPPDQRSWFGRNWKWLVPVGCLAPIILCCGFFSVIWFTVTGVIKSSDAYTQAVAAARANEEVKALLGEPISEGMMPTGNISINDAHGDADLSISISGPKGSATLHAVATKDAGKWTFSKLEVVPAGEGQKIDLRKQLPGNP